MQRSKYMETLKGGYAVSFEISPIWREAFSLAWDAFCRGSVPVGCVVVDGEDRILARGQNAIYDDEIRTPLAGTNLAHAEMVALSKLRNSEHNPRLYTLYTTLEPCPMCFGAIAMMGIKQVRYAARDAMAGSAALTAATPYLRSKGIHLEWEDSPLEVFQIALATAFELNRKHPKQQQLLELWESDCPVGVHVGTALYQRGDFHTAVRERWEFEQVFARVMTNSANVREIGRGGGLYEDSAF